MQIQKKIITDQLWAQQRLQYIQESKKLDYNYLQTIFTQAFARKFFQQNLLNKYQKTHEGSVRTGNKVASAQPNFYGWGAQPNWKEYIGAAYKQVSKIKKLIYIEDSYSTESYRQRGVQVARKRQDSLAGPFYYYNSQQEGYILKIDTIQALARKKKNQFSFTYWIYKFGTVQMKIGKQSSSIAFGGSQLTKSKKQIFFTTLTKYGQKTTSHLWRQCKVLQHYFGSNIGDFNIIWYFTLLNGTQGFIYFPFTLEKMMIQGNASDKMKKIINSGHAPDFYIRSPQVLRQFLHLLLPNVKRPYIQSQIFFTGDIPRQVFEQVQNEYKLYKRSEDQFQALIEKAVKCRSKRRAQQYGEALTKIKDKQKQRALFKDIIPIPKIQPKQQKKRQINQIFKGNQFLTFNDKKQEINLKEPMQNPLLSFVSSLTVFSFKKSPHVLVLEKIVAIMARQSMKYYFMTIKQQIGIQQCIVLMFDIGIQLYTCQYVFQFISNPGQIAFGKIMMFFSQFHLGLNQDSQMRQMLQDEIVNMYKTKSFAEHQKISSSADQIQFSNLVSYQESIFVRTQAINLNNQINQMETVITNLIILLTEIVVQCNFQLFFTNIKIIYEFLYRKSLVLRQLYKKNEAIPKSVSFSVKRNRNFLLLDTIAIKMMFQGLYNDLIYKIALIRYGKTEKKYDIEQYRIMMSPIFSKIYTYSTLTSKDKVFSNQLLTISANDPYISLGDYHQCKRTIQQFINITQRNFDANFHSQITKSFNQGQPMKNILVRIRKQAKNQKIYLKKIKQALSRIHGNHILHIQNHLKNISQKTKMKIKDSWGVVENYDSYIEKLPFVNKVLKRYDFPQYSFTFPSIEEVHTAQTMINKNLDIYLYTTDSLRKFNGFLNLTSQFFRFPPVQVNQTIQTEQFQVQIPISKQQVLKVFRNFFIERLKQKPSQKIVYKKQYVDITQQDLIQTYQMQIIRQSVGTFITTMNIQLQRLLNSSNKSNSNVYQYLRYQSIIANTNNNYSQIVASLVGVQNKMAKLQQFKESFRKNILVQQENYSYWDGQNRLAQLYNKFGQRGVQACAQKLFLIKAGLDTPDYISKANQNNFNLMQKQLNYVGNILNDMFLSNAPRTQRMDFLQIYINQMISLSIKIIGQKDISDKVNLFKNIVIQPFQQIQVKSGWLVGKIQLIQEQITSKYFKNQQIMIKIQQKMQQQREQIIQQIDNLKSDIMKQNQQQLQNFMTKIHQTQIQQNWGDQFVKIPQEHYFGNLKFISQAGKTIQLFCNAFGIVWNGVYNDLIFQIDQRQKQLALPSYLTGQIKKILTALNYSNPDDITGWNTVILSQIKTYLMRIQQLSQNIRFYQGQIAVLNQQINNLKQQIKEQNDHVYDTDGKFHALAQENAKLQALLDQKITNMMQAHQQQKINLKKNFQVGRSGDAKLIEDARIQIQKLHGNIKFHNQAFIDLQKQVQIETKKTQQNVAKLQAQIAKKTIDLNNMAKIQRELQQSVKRNKELVQQNKQLQKNWRQLQESASNLVVQAKKQAKMRPKIFQMRNSSLKQRIQKLAANSQSKVSLALSQQSQIQYSKRPFTLKQAIQQNEQLKLQLEQLKDDASKMIVQGQKLEQANRLYFDQGTKLLAQYNALAEGYQELIKKSFATDSEMELLNIKIRSQKRALNTLNSQVSNNTILELIKSYQLQLQRLNQERLQIIKSWKSMVQRVKDADQQKSLTTKLAIQFDGLVRRLQFPGLKKNQFQIILNQKALTLSQVMNKATRLLTIITQNTFKAVDIQPLKKVQVFKQQLKDTQKYRALKQQAAQFTKGIAFLDSTISMMLSSIGDIHMQYKPKLIVIDAIKQIQEQIKDLAGKLSQTMIRVSKIDQKQFQQINTQFSILKSSMQIRGQLILKLSKQMGEIMKKSIQNIECIKKLTAKNQQLGVALKKKQEQTNKLKAEKQQQKKFEQQSNKKKTQLASKKDKVEPEKARSLKEAFKAHIQSQINADLKKNYLLYFQALDQQIAKNKPTFQKSQKIMNQIVKMMPKARNFKFQANTKVQIKPQPQPQHRNVPPPSTIPPPKPQTIQNSKKEQSELQNMKVKLLHQKQLSFYLYGILFNIFQKLQQVMKFFQSNIQQFQKLLERQGMSKQMKNTFQKIIQFYGSSKELIQNIIETPKEMQGLYHLDDMKKRVQQHFEQTKKMFNQDNFSKSKYFK